ncbi:MAG: site-specific integrase [Puia sp.]|nr:site-specific integrase [Puia sp.]
MFLPIKPIIDRRPRKDGTSVITIQYCYSSDRRTLLFTGLAVPPRYWNKKLLRISPELPTDFGNPEQMNLRLQRMIRAAEDIVLFAVQKQIEDPVEFLKKVFHPEFESGSLPEKAKQLTQDDTKKKEVNLDFFFQLDDYIKSKTRKVSTGMMRTYNVMKNRLLAFQKWRKQKITFTSFDFNFYEDFVNYLTYEHMHMRRNIAIRGLKRNSVGTSIKQLRIFLRDRTRRKIIPAIDLSDFKILDEETDAIYLSVEEIRTLYNLDLSGHPEWSRFRDLFVLGSFTGLRFSDFNGIKPEDIRNGMLYKKQGKSDHWVVIPLRPEANDILMNRFKRKVPPTSNAELNRYIKKVGQLAGINMPIKVSYKKGNQDMVAVKPKYALITTHTCRRSFCTNEFLAGTPPELIMKISGHKSIKDFYKYIRITPEEAGKQIREIWERRGEMEKA